MKKIALVAVVTLATSCLTSYQPAHLTDPEIAMVMRIANLSEVREGNIAREKATDASVREFAVMMVNEHTEGNVKTEEALAKKEIPSDDSNTSRELDAASAAAADSLRATAAGPAFDRMYIDRQISVHESLQSTIEKTLLPAARASVVKTALNDMQKTVTKHLERARQIRAALK
jgi:putative membrane protein